MATPIYSAIRQICEEKGLAEELVIETIETALAAAYRKDFGEPNQNVKITFNPETGAIKAWDEKEVVTNELKAETEAARAAAMAAREAEKRGEISHEEAKAAKEKEREREDEEKEARYNPKFHFSLDEAQVVKPDAAVGDIITTDLPVPGEFGRMAAQTAKQVIIQKLREAERTTTFNEFKGQEHEVMNGSVQRREGRVVLVDVGRTTGILLPDGQIERENYRPGMRMKVYVQSVTMTPKGPEIILSRTNEEIVKKMFEVEIPEVANGSVEIRGVAREAGARTKVAVIALDENIDPIGSCVGQRGSRIQTIIHELGGEKVDIIQHDEDAQRYIMNALSPAKVDSIVLREEEKKATVFVASDQLSLAIGKGGQNVRLASRLTGWELDIRGTEKTSEDSKVSEDGEDDGDSKAGEEEKALEETRSEAEKKENEEVGTKEEKQEEKTGESDEKNMEDATKTPQKEDGVKEEEVPKEVIDEKEESPETKKQE